MSRHRCPALPHGCFTNTLVVLALHMCFILICVPSPGTDAQQTFAYTFRTDPNAKLASGCSGATGSGCFDTKQQECVVMNGDRRPSRGFIGSATCGYESANKLLMDETRHWHVSDIINDSPTKMYTITLNKNARSNWPLAGFKNIKLVKVSKNFPYYSVVNANGACLIYGGDGKDKYSQWYRWPGPASAVCGCSGQLGDGKLCHAMSVFEIKRLVETMASRATNPPTTKAPVTTTKTTTTAKKTTQTTGTGPTTTTVTVTTTTTTATITTTTTQTTITVTTSTDYCALCPCEVFNDGLVTCLEYADQVDQTCDGHDKWGKVTRCKDISDGKGGTITKTSSSSSTTVSTVSSSSSSTSTASSTSTSTISAPATTADDDCHDDHTDGDSDGCHDSTGGPGQGNPSTPLPAKTDDPSTVATPSAGCHDDHTDGDTNDCHEDEDEPSTTNTDKTKTRKNSSSSDQDDGMTAVVVVLVLLGVVVVVAGVVIWMALSKYKQQNAAQKSQFSNPMYSSDPGGGTTARNQGAFGLANTNTNAGAYMDVSGTKTVEGVVTRGDGDEV